MIADEATDAGEKIVGRARLEVEFHAQVAVLILGFCQTADYQDGYFGSEAAEMRDKLSAVHSGHHVVCDDEVDGSGELVVAKLL